MPLIELEILTVFEKFEYGIKFKGKIFSPMDQDGRIILSAKNMDE